MRIAVNTRLVLPDQMGSYGHFTWQVFSRMAEQHPEHTFYFYFDQPYDSSLRFPANVNPVVLLPKARNFVSFKYWFDVKVALALKRHKADVFISPDGLCSLTTAVPQVLVVHDLGFLHFPAFTPKPNLLFYKTYSKKFFKKAKVIATLSEFTRQDVITHFNIDANKLTTVGSAARRGFTPLEWDEREQVKDRFALGCEYFVFIGGVHPRNNLLTVLKAFSLFKKRQQSNMKLVVVGRLDDDKEHVLEKLKTYKFRQEVVLPGYIPDEDLYKVVAGAYALVYPALFGGFGMPILEAMQSGVPVITSTAGSMPEVGGMAALYVDTTNENDIAEKLKLIYKDEPLRSRMVADGYARAAAYNWQNTTDAMWAAIQQAVSL